MHLKTLVIILCSLILTKLFCQELAIIIECKKKNTIKYVYVYAFLKFTTIPVHA